MTKLYDLLPGIYRYRDQLEQHPLEALLSVLQSQFDLIEEDIAALYDNWFIETCAEWAVPYIGQLVGVDIDVHDVIQRARIANALTQRAYKGTSSALEEMITLSTGWSAYMVPYMKTISATQSMIQPNPMQGRTANISSNQSIKTGTAFDPHSYTVTVRSPLISHVSSQSQPEPATPTDTHKQDAVGLFIWRHQPNIAVDVMSAALEKRNPQSFFIHPLAVETLLYPLPARGYEILNLATRESVPQDILQTLPLPEQMALYKRLPKMPPFIHIRVGDQEIATRDIQFAALRDIPGEVGWQMVTSATSKTRSKVYVDPLRGRLWFPKPVQDAVRCSFVYGSGSDIGGGAYERSTLSSQPQDNQDPVWRAYVGSQLASHPLQFNTLADAVSAWQAVKMHGVIQIVDSDRYTSKAPLTITCEEGYRLVIEATPGQCPTLEVPLIYQATKESSFVALSGLWLDAPLTLSGHITLYIEHCTLNPPRQNKPQPALTTQSADDCHVFITKSIVGALQLPVTARLRVEDSVVHGDAYGALYASSAVNSLVPSAQRPMSAISHLERTTIFGRVEVEQMAYASDVLFHDEVVVHQKDNGGMRFCYVPSLDQLPPYYRCLSSAEAKIPYVVSHTYGHPAYAQLSPLSASEILMGGSDESEIGVFHHLYQAQRRKTLVQILGEFLPAYLKPVTVFVD